MHFRSLIMLSAAAAAFAFAPLVPASAAAGAVAAGTASSVQVRAEKPAAKQSKGKAAASGKKAASKNAAAAGKAKSQAKKGKAPAKQQAQRRPRRRTQSVATLAGLYRSPDPLELSSSVGFMMDADTGEVFYDKNAAVRLPIASLTKMMTALVIVESGLDMRQKLRLTREDYVSSTARSKLRNGMVLTREAALQAALMSSDNRAAHMLARTYPGGVSAFVAAMNEKAAELGMSDTRFADPTGLSDSNVSTARDLAELAAEAGTHPLICRLSTTQSAVINAGRWLVALRTTNRLLSDSRWHVDLQKTGYTRAAGRCMLVQCDLDGRRMVMVVLDSLSSVRRADDMMRMRQSVEQASASLTIPVSADPMGDLLGRLEEGKRGGRI